MTIANWNETNAVVTRANSRGPADLIFKAGGEEMLRVSRGGFYVRGELIQQDAQEARRVHAAFVKWLRLQGMAV